MHSAVEIVFTRYRCSVDFVTSNTKEEKVGSVGQSSPTSLYGSCDTKDNSLVSDAQLNSGWLTVTLRSVLSRHLLGKLSPPNIETSPKNFRPRLP